jgi:hypothetical protein
MITFASQQLRNHSRLKHSSRKRPLKHSSIPFCHGLPGSFSAVSMPEVSSHSRIALLTNSEPLSDRRYRGAPRSLMRACQHFDHTRRADAAGYIDRQALAGELVDDREAFEALAIRACIEDEIVGPQEVGVARWNRPWP